MILLISTFIFLASFFLMNAFSLPHPLEAKINERVKKRLQGGGETRQEAIRLAIKERLSDLPFLDRILGHFQKIKSFQVYIRQSGLRISAGALILICLVLGLVSFLLVTRLSVGWAAGLPIVALMSASPLGGVAFMRARRSRQFSEAFPDAIARMASSLRAGYSLQMAFEAIIQDTANLVREEFKQVVAEMQLGQSFEEALKKMLERIDIAELRLFISSVILQRDSGGNLAELFDNLESTIRARFELQRELSAASAQGKLSGMVLSLLPLFVGLMVFMIHREYVLFFFKDPAGKKLLGLSIMGQLMGIWTIRKIIRFDM